MVEDRHVQAPDPRNNPAKQRYIVQELQWTDEEKKAWARQLAFLSAELFLEETSRQLDLGIVEKINDFNYPLGA